MRECASKVARVAFPCRDFGMDVPFTRYKTEFAGKPTSGGWESVVCAWHYL
jgi:hypothetical protein